jgi:uncharacterized phage protein (TIGR01671 family)
VREIKFRGKQVNTGEWLYGDLIHNNEQTLINPIFQEPYEYPDDFDGNVLPETVGEYTGLPDKHGKEIYEGDIVRGNKGNKSNDVWVVFWNVKEAEFSIRPHDFRYHYKLNGLGKVEVVGNIYQNPDLLEVTP